MRIGLCSIAFRDRELEGVLRLAKAIGYEGVEVWGREPHLCERFDAERAGRIRMLFREYGLELVSISPYIRFTSLEPAVRSGEEERGLEMLRVAEEMGCPRMRVYAGSVGSKQAVGEHWDACIQGLRALGERADEAGVTVCVENHGNTLADTTDTTLRVVEEVRRRRVGILFDPINLWPEDPVDSARRQFRYTRLVHLKNKPRGEGPLPLLSQGAADFAPALRFLRNLGYKDFVDVEFVSPENPENAALEDYKYLRSVLG